MTRSFDVSQFPTKYEFKYPPKCGDVDKTRKIGNDLSIVVAYIGLLALEVSETPLS